MDCTRFVTFEGGDGTGKSLHIRLLYDRLKEEGYKICVTREPGGTELGECLRTILLTESTVSIKTVCALFIAARAHHLERIIRPALAQGMWVLCDRFIHSTFVYQGVIAGLDSEFIRVLHEQLEAYVLPGLTFVLEVDPQEGYVRCKKRHADETNILDPKDFSVYCSVLEAYSRLTLGNIVRISARSVEDTITQIWNNFNAYVALNSV